MKTPSTRMIEFQWPEVAKHLFDARGITSGYWRIAVKLRLAGMTAKFEEVSTGKADHLPTALVGIDCVALEPVDGPGPLIFDAGNMTSDSAVAQPAPKPRIAAAKKAPARRAATKAK